MAYLPYKEPGVTTILSLTAFLLLLNGVRYVFDRILYCGIIGEILLGIVWGLPVGGTAWLSEATQETVQALGYLGLISLVFEGGLSTDISLLRKNAYASVSVATIGLLMPIALSFILLSFPFSNNAGTVAYPTPLAAFSAGASLCSTSLGTTFAILSAANLQNTRVGVVLVGAAMMDDVVGLVMVNIVTTLGKGGAGGWLIARPIIASFGLLLVTLIMSPYVLRPAWCWFLSRFSRNAQLAGQRNSGSTRWTTVMNFGWKIPHLSFIISIIVLIIFVTIASFIDASVLFAAFIAGGVLKYLWTVSDEPLPPESTSQDGGPVKMYADYLKPVMDGILIPFFFASIGFSIPIKDMFTGAIVWKGIVYALLMILAKATVSSVPYSEYVLTNWRAKARRRNLQRLWRKERPRPESATAMETLPSEFAPSDASPTIEPPTSPPHSTALLLGLAMVARGEIGFLIASLSQSSGTLGLRRTGSATTEPPGGEVFLVVVWAVVVCTIVGPLGVGLIVRRLRA